MALEEPLYEIRDFGEIAPVTTNLRAISKNRLKIYDAVGESAAAIANKVSTVVKILKPGQERIVAQVFGLSNKPAGGKSEDGSIWFNEYGLCRQHYFDNLPLDIVRILVKKGIHAVSEGRKPDKTTDFVLFPETFTDEENSELIVYNLYLRRLSRISKYLKRNRMTLALLLAGGIVVTSATVFWYLNQGVAETPSKMTLPENDSRLK